MHAGASPLAMAATGPATSAAAGPAIATLGIGSSPHAGTGEEAAEVSEPTILIADDDPLIVATLGAGLRSAGFGVLEAFDGASALECCVARRPSLAVIDYAMPGSNGVELARLVAQRTPVPVIFLSAYSDEAIVSEAIAAGAMTYLVKPIDVEQLLPAIRTALRRAEEMQALRAELAASAQRMRSISIATGLIMARFQIGQQEAFERLRRHARTTRRRMEEVAAALLRSAEETHGLYEALSHPVSPVSKRPDEGR